MKRTQQALDPLMAALREDVERWKTMYDYEHQRIVDFALQHSPKLRASNEDHLPGFDMEISQGGNKQPEFVCNAPECHSFWPCPSYRWATGTGDFKLVADPTKDADGTQ